MLQTLLFVSAVLMGNWVKLPTPGLVALVVVGIALFWARISTKRTVFRFTAIIGWICLFAVPVSVPFGKNNLFVVDSYYAALIWMIAVGISVGILGIRDEWPRRQWKMLAAAWAFLGTFIWVSVFYVWNRPAPFFSGLVLALVLLISCKVTFDIPRVGILTINTLILVIIVIPIADLVMRPNYRMVGNADLDKKFYSYEAARKDPVAFGRWWKFYLNQWYSCAGQITELDPTFTFPMLLRTNTHGKFFDNDVVINSLGFRGKEFSPDKGDAYRIVALGESTTFGFDMKRDEKPWPELLEEIIRERLKPTRRVEVINAGIPRYSLRHSLLRLPTQILPLKPDMIISYHGANGFEMIHSAVPLQKVELPPAYQPRPMKLLADSEYRLKMIFYRTHPSRSIPEIALSEAMKTDYAQAYRELVEISKTNQIQLVLATYSMAVNAHSERDVIEFYRGGFPMVDWWIKANETHSKIVAEITKENPGVVFIDTHPHLDGNHQKFADLMHFTGEGDQQMAETMFTGIKDVLAKELAPSK